jgi:hypothetical protein
LQCGRSEGISAEADPVVEELVGAFRAEYQTRSDRFKKLAMHFITYARK